MSTVAKEESCTSEIRLGKRQRGVLRSVANWRFMVCLKGMNIVPLQQAAAMQKCLPIDFHIFLRTQKSKDLYEVLQILNVDDKHI